MKAKFDKEFTCGYISDKILFRDRLTSNMDKTSLRR